MIVHVGGANHGDWPRAADAPDELPIGQTDPGGSIDDFFSRAGDVLDRAEGIERHTPEPEWYPVEGDPFEDNEATEIGSDRRELADMLGKGLRNVRDTLFEQSELAVISRQLREMDGKLDVLAEQCSLNAGQVAAVRAMLADARDNSQRMGRKDWLLVGIGAATSLVITGAVPAGAMLAVGKMAAKWVTEVLAG